MSTDRKVKKSRKTTPKKSTTKKVIKNTQKRAVKESFTSKRGHSIRYGKDVDSVAARRASIKKQKADRKQKEREEKAKLKKEQRDKRAKERKEKSDRDWETESTSFP